MSLRFYADTHIAKQVAVQLRKRGVDIVRCEEVGMAEASDDEHLEYATQEGRALISIDTDFRGKHIDWLMAEKSHAGIFAISEQLQGEGGIGTIVRELFEYHQLIENGAASWTDDVQNQIIFVR